ncbi:TPA: terminase small subunit [Klebsiella pneumoniae]|uniref:terminase small subunit n=1 Tax=Klebsiella pneumoniae TaxID=573 RepID=UPI0039744C7E|nr:terminase small subunit [Klebsiella pneumoniae]
MASVVSNRVENELSKIMEQGGDIDDAELLKARIRLTNAQADAQELENARETGEVIDTAFVTYALSKLAGEVEAIMDSLPLAISRQFPGMEKRYLDSIKRRSVRRLIELLIFQIKYQKWLNGIYVKIRRANDL